MSYPPTSGKGKDAAKMEMSIEERVAAEAKQRSFERSLAGPSVGKAGKLYQSMQMVHMIWFTVKVSQGTRQVCKKVYTNLSRYWMYSLRQKSTGSLPKLPKWVGWSLLYAPVLLSRTSLQGSKYVKLHFYHFQSLIWSGFTITKCGKIKSSLRRSHGIETRYVCHSWQIPWH